MKKTYTWTVLVVLLAAMLIVFNPSIMAGGKGQGNGNEGNETSVGITVEPPSSGGGAVIQSTEVKDLDLTVSADNPTANDTVTLTVFVDVAVSKIRITAEITNKNHLKIKWYKFLENGHLLINGNPGQPGSGNSWDYGTVWESSGPVKSGEHTIEIPITFDLTANSVNPRDIPTGSTNKKATILWTLSIGSY